MAVYVIWFDMWPGDTRSEWKDKLVDPRAVNLWDEGQMSEPTPMMAQCQA